MDYNRMKVRKELFLFLGIVAALFVVWILWHVSVERPTEPVGAIDTVRVVRSVTLEPVDTPSSPVVVKKTPRKRIVQRFDERGGGRR